MTTSSRVIGIVKCILVNAPSGVNLAAPAETVHQSRPLRRFSLWRDSLYDRCGRAVATEWDGLNLLGLASATRAFGSRAWRIDRLYLPGLDNELETATSVGLHLLDAVSQAAGYQSAERIFLRVRSDSPVVKMAQRTGYFPYYEETHLHGQPELLDPGDKDQGHPLWPLMPEDELALFQLHCASTPPQVRVGTGLTLEQWRDAQDRPNRKASEMIIWDGSRIAGWISFDYREKINSAQVLHRPEHPKVLRSLLANACARPGDQSWLVPDYQEPVGTILLRQGLKEIGRYTMLIKTLAVPAVSREYYLAEA